MFTTFSDGVKTEREILLQIKNLPIKSCFDMVFNFRNRRSFHQNKPKQICKSWKRPTRKLFLDFHAGIFHRPPGPRTDRFDIFKFGPLPVLGPTSFGPLILGQSDIFQFSITKNFFRLLEELVVLYWMFVLIFHLFYRGYQIRLYHLVIGWHTLECNTSHVKSYKSVAV